MIKTIKQYDSNNNKPLQISRLAEFSHNSSIPHHFDRPEIDNFSLNCISAIFAFSDVWSNQIWQSIFQEQNSIGLLHLLQ